MYLLHMTMTTGFQTFEADLRVDFRVRIAILKVSKRAPADKSLADTARGQNPRLVSGPTLHRSLRHATARTLGRPHKADPILHLLVSSLYQ